MNHHRKTRGEIIRVYRPVRPPAGVWWWANRFYLFTNDPWLMYYVFVYLFFNCHTPSPAWTSRQSISSLGGRERYRVIIISDRHRPRRRWRRRRRNCPSVTIYHTGKRNGENGVRTRRCPVRTACWERSIRTAINYKRNIMKKRLTIISNSVRLFRT